MPSSGRFLDLTAACVCSLGIALQAAHAQSPAAMPTQPAVAYTGIPVPLLSLDTVHFLEGTWSALSRDGRQTLGSYSFARELNGHILARHSLADANCAATHQPACGRQDLFYVFQDSPGAPLKAINFDSEGHVIHYLVSQSAQASTSTFGRREFVVFESDPAEFGPRVRLRYEHNVDTQTGKDSLSGAFETLLANGSWRVLQEWYGIRQ